MPGGMPGGAQQGAPGMDVRSKMSVMNPTDMAAKASRGDIRKGQSVGEFLQKNYGVSPQDPVEKLFQSVKAQAQNSTVPGKMGAPPARPPQARPQMPGASPGGMPGGGMPPKNMDELTGRM